MELTSFEDLEKNPNKYGVPTFEQFAKNPGFFRINPEETFLLAETGSTIFKKNIKKYRFFIDGYECKSIEAVERIAIDQGYRREDLDICPEIISVGGGKVEFHVKFKNKPKGVILT